MIVSLDHEMEALAQSCELSYYWIHFDAKMKNIYFRVEKWKDAILMQKRDFMLKMWNLHWKWEYYDELWYWYLLDAKYVLYIKNDEFSHKVVEMIWKCYLQCKDVIFIDKAC